MPVCGFSVTLRKVHFAFEGKAPMLVTSPFVKGQDVRHTTGNVVKSVRISYELYYFPQGTPEVQILG